MLFLLKLFLIALSFCLIDIDEKEGKDEFGCDLFSCKSFSYAFLEFTTESSFKFKNGNYPTKQTDILERHVVLHAEDEGKDKAKNYIIKIDGPCSEDNYYVFLVNSGNFTARGLEFEQSNKICKAYFFTLLGEDGSFNFFTCRFKFSDKEESISFIFNVSDGHFRG